METAAGPTSHAGLQISIHSTTRVETLAPALLRYVHGDFNPLHHEGGDNSLAVSIEQSDRISIHSTTRVETCSEEDGPVTISYFNPLHHEGGDISAYSGNVPEVEFQSTPPRGWRRWMTQSPMLSYSISIHSTTRVETFASNPYFFLVCISIHSTTRVETPNVAR